MGGLCRLFGVTKQAYYKGADTGRAEREAGLEEDVVSFVLAVRSLIGGIGGRKLWLMYCRDHGRIGRDHFEAILDRCGLKLRRKRRRTRTTDSRHGLPVHPNLVYDKVPTRPDEVWVSDITYVPVHNTDGSVRFCYLSIVMDAYTRQILGYSIGPDLSATYPLLALQMAMCRRLKQKRSLDGIIHHSDRGVQYASAEYVACLRRHGMLVSMTESGNPKDNPQAERINGTVKNELLSGLTLGGLSEAREALPGRIDFYNRLRPHMSLDMMTPDEADQHTGPQCKRWVSYRDLAIAKANSEADEGACAQQADEEAYRREAVGTAENDQDEGMAYGIETEKKSLTLAYP